MPVLDNIGSPVGGAALSSMAYSLPPTPAKSGMGKNQQRALALLEGMHRDIAERPARQGRDDQPVLIEHEDWRQRCEDDGIQRSRYKEARDALEKRRAIRLDGPHVFLLLEFVRTSLGDSDAVETEPCGPLDASDSKNRLGGFWNVRDLSRFSGNVLDAFLHQSGQSNLVLAGFSKADQQITFVQRLAVQLSGPEIQS